MKHSQQCMRILHRLQEGPATSWELQALGVCSHTSRISELRKQGCRIERLDRWQGRKRIVTYRLMGQAELRFEEVA